jgi:hypothetical protein
MSQVRARRAAPVSPDVKARSRTGVGEVATRHRMAAGTGWKAPRAGEEDGLDVMITGVLNGSEEVS